MRKTLLVCFGLFVVILSGIVIWYATHTRQIQSQLDQFVADAEKQKLVAVEFVVTPPKDTPADQMLYLAGSAATLGNWEAAGLPLERREDGKCHGSAEVMSGVEYEFKVTRGTWGTVETNDKGEERGNRVLKVAGVGSIDVSVARWRDGGKTVPNRVTMTGDIRLHKKFRSSNLNNERTLIVYVPPDYDKIEGMRYPVLYMQDGQNLFDAATSYAGIEWRVDEAAQQLIAAKTIPPMIVVGIYNGGVERADEFTPPSMAADAKKGRGDLYAKFVVDEVKPFIDKTYRTQPGKQHTALAGGSQGGLISLHIAKTYPQTFGQIALFSPWLRVGDKQLIAADLGDGLWAKGMRIYAEMGGEGRALYPTLEPLADGKALDKFLSSAGLKADSDYKYLEIPDLEHNEPAWSTRVEPMLTWLYGKGGATTQTASTLP